MRAAQTQSLLAAVERLPAADRTKIRALIGEAAIDRVLDALSVTFLPMSLHMHVSDCIRDVVGPGRNVDVWRETMLFAFDRPLLRSFVEMTTRIFGVSPSGLFKRAQKVNELITRNAGSLSFEPTGPHSGTMTLTGFPAHQFRFICYVEGLAGCLEATLALCRCTGSVKVLEQAADGRVSYAIEWRER
jgi:hypothetical protein